MLHLSHPQTVRAFRTIRRLLLAYLAVSVAALVAIVLMRNDPAEVNATAWIRGSIVAVTAGLLLLFADRAAQGSTAAYRRLRIISIVTVAVIVAIVAAPGALPTWMRIEQGTCGLLMAGVAVLTSRPWLRALFPPDAAPEDVTPSMK